MRKLAEAKLGHFLNVIVPLGEEALKSFLSKLSYEEVPKNTRLVSAGSNSQKMYFLAEGYVKYQLVKDDSKQVVHIAGNGVLVSDFFSYYSNQKAITDISTITNAQLMVIEKDTLEELYGSSLAWANFGRKVAENAMLRQIMEKISMQTKSAEERYRQILISNPELFKVVKLGDLAEILGITQETLSRIRARLK